MATVQVGDYELIFDDGGIEPKGLMEEANTAIESDNAEENLPTVVSDVVSNRPPAKPRGPHKRSKSEASNKSSAAPSPLNTPLYEQNFDTNLSRLRTRPEPKAVPSDVSEALAAMDEEIREEGPPRKRGRPKGSKNKVSYGPATATEKVKKASTSGSGTPANGEVRRRGRPPKPPELSAREIYLQSEPDYKVFGCEWQDESTGMQCPAELHNMEVLRLHVNVVHGDMEPLTCRWGKCARQKPPIRFEDEEAFEKHMEEAHLISYQWHMGDGIRNRGIWKLEQDPDHLPAYLFDKDGNQVTPSIKDQQFDDAAGMQHRRRKLKAIRRLADANAPTEDDFEMQTLGSQGKTTTLA